MVKQYSLKKDGEKKLQPNFRVSEFACADGADKILIEDELVGYLQRIRDCLGLSSLKVICGYRTEEYNKTLKRASMTSRHLLGKAADVRGYINQKAINPAFLCCAAEVLGMTGIGLIETCAHLDTRENRSWFDENKGNRGLTTFGHYSFFTYCNISDINFIDKNPFPVPVATVKMGMKGESVRWLQFELVKRGLLDLVSRSGKCNIDGSFGNDTYCAVVAFQALKELETDGRVGGRTRKSIISRSN